jgi:uncharacterized protein (TIGR02284 family)
MPTMHQITESLNDLIETCCDGQNGFQVAAEAVEEPALKKELMSYSTQRRGFATQLRRFVESHGEKPRDRGSFGAVLHRGWIDLRKAVAGRQTYAILAECERGEDSAIAAYRKALESDLPPEEDSTVRMQYMEVLTTHRRIKDLRDMAKAN